MSMIDGGFRLGEYVFLHGRIPVHRTAIQGERSAPISSGFYLSTKTLLVGGIFLSANHATLSTRLVFLLHYMAEKMIISFCRSVYVL